MLVERILWFGQLTGRPISDDHLLILHGVCAVAVEGKGHRHRPLCGALRQRRRSRIDRALEDDPRFGGPAVDIESAGSTEGPAPPPPSAHRRPPPPAQPPPADHPPNP